MATITGTNGADKLFGKSLADLISGLDGHDTLYGVDGNDTLYGGDGNDLLDGDPGDGWFELLGRDTVLGGDGHDTFVVSDTAGGSISGGAGTDRLMLNWGAQTGAVSVNLTLVPTPLTPTGPNAIVAGGQRLTLARIEALSLTSGSGNDSVVAGAGNDVLDMGSGADTVVAGSGNDAVVGGAGNDVIDAGSGADSVAAGDGNDRVTDVMGSGGSLDGGTGLDVLMLQGTSTAPLEVYLDHDEETLRVLTGSGGTADGFESLSMIGSTGNDFIEMKTDHVFEPWTPGPFTLVADLGDGNDSVAYHTENTDYMELLGNATLHGGAGDDQLNGLVGDSSLYGGGGRDILRSSWGNDIFDGGDQDDSLSGGAGNDVVVGGAGNDSIGFAIFRDFEPEVGQPTRPYVDSGADQLAGGSGADAFYFYATNCGTGYIPQVYDHQTGVDRLIVHGSDEWFGHGANSAQPRQLTSAEFALGAATTAHAQVVYVESAAGDVLHFDADGTGAGAA